MLLPYLLLAGASSIAVAQHAHPLQEEFDEAPAAAPAKRVAIIGAGAAGTSTAYHLRQYASAAHIPLNITIFERSPYIGGRSTTVHPFDDPTLPSIELGASIFVTVNYILAAACETFNLSVREPYQFDPSKPVMGIYDGEGLVVTAKTSGWWDNVKMLWRYGMAPIKANRLMKETVGKFLNIYAEPMFPFPDLTKRVYDLGLREAVGVTGEQFLKENGIGEKFSQEVMQAMTRVNYAQNLPLIHGLETMVSIATDGAMAVDGGNWRIFESMAKSSTSDIHLSTNVETLTHHDNGSYTIISNSSSADSSAEFDAVVLAAPYQYAGLDLKPKPSIVPDEIPYVNLHVTLFTSRHYLNPEAFGLSKDETVPQMLLTTLQGDERPGANATYESKAGFFSISLLGKRLNRQSGEDEYLYKIFSPQNITSSFLARTLGLPENKELHKDDVSWVYRKLWQSYPYEYPRVTFEALRLDDNLWYTSGIESFISTMETSALMGKNVARLVVDEWVSKQHGSGKDTSAGTMDRPQQHLQVEL